MKILNFSYAYIGSYSDPRGWLNRIEFFTGLLERMTGHAQVVAIYNIRFKGALTHNGVSYLFPEFKKRSLRFPLKFNRYILSLQPDVVLIQGFSPWQIFLLGRTSPGLKILVQHRAEKPFSGIKAILQKLADKYISYYFFSSTALAEIWIELRQIESKLKVVEALGMSSVFNPIEKRLALSRTDVDSDLVFLWVGDLNANKNPLLAIEAFMEFVKDYPSALLLLIYHGSELESALRSRIQGEKNIRLVGKVAHEEMIHWYNSADFILSTSYYESAGLAVCEGMSCGCIPVLTDIPSFRMMTDGGRVGLLFEPGKRDSLIFALGKCVSMNREEKKAAVLAYFELKLSFEASVRAIMEVVK